MTDEEDEIRIQQVIGQLDGHTTWIRNFAVTIEQDYDTLMAAAARWVMEGVSTQDPSPFNTAAWSTNFDEFWEHYEALTGKKVKQKDVFFVCNC